jgi:hypothetical protein
MGYIIKEIEIVGTRKIKNVLAMFDSSSFKNYIMDVPICEYTLNIIRFIHRLSDCGRIESNNSLKIFML